MKRLIANGMSHSFNNYDEQNVNLCFKLTKSDEVPFNFAIHERSTVWSTELAIELQAKKFPEKNVCANCLPNERKQISDIYLFIYLFFWKSVTTQPKHLNRNFRKQHSNNVNFFHCSRFSIKIWNEIREEDTLKTRENKKRKTRAHERHMEMGKWYSLFFEQTFLWWRKTKIFTFFSSLLLFVHFGAIFFFILGRQFL